MRTEDDLRAALGSLERCAPEPEGVLAGTRVRVARRRRMRLGGGLGAAAVTAAAVVAVMQLPPGGSAHPDGVAAGTHTASSTTLQAKLLAALNAASGRIMYARITAEGPHGGSELIWDFPWNPKPGQRALGRALVLNANGTPSIDMESIYTASGPKSAPLMGELKDIQYDNRTWSDQKHVVIDSVGLWNPASLRAEFAHMHPTVRRVELFGHRALELSWEAPGSPGMPVITRSWVDARTYLPLRMETSGGGAATAPIDFKLLPATPANLAKLRVVVPAGFRRTPKVVK